jgi:hypothetical protein
MNVDKTTWLDSLKPGDTVIYIDYAMMERNRSVKTITRVTATMVFMETRYTDRTIEHRISRRDGRLIGGDRWHCPYIEPATPEVIAEVKAETRRRFLVHRISKKTEWDNVPTDVLEAVYAILNPPKSPDA